MTQAISTMNLADAKYGKYEFGLSKESIAAGLRAAANDIENGIAVPLSATTLRRVQIDNYPISIIVVKLAESLDVANRYIDNHNESDESGIIEAIVTSD